MPDSDFRTANLNWETVILLPLYPNKYNPLMKAIAFLGDSLKSIREFPNDARRDAGFQLRRIQRGLRPIDSKSMPGIGRGVEEITIWDEEGTFRVIYTARLADVVYVLHAFQKKTQTTSKRDINKAKERFTELMKETQ
jgi:phage-related protein